MKIYLVGGAVRDQLLGLPVQEKDWVVVGATVEEMLQKNFRQVGKDFPVFLHPDTHEEYALARMERKTGRGYTGFAFDASPQVTLEEDLKRRDLTINAMAQTVEGILIDPYHGKQDLAQKILRHVSPAFAEDPVRILRVARFAARYNKLGFTVATETNELMKQMVVSGEVDALVAERVWKELERALAEENPEQFFKVLADCTALAVLFPQINMQGPGMTALVQAAKISSDARVRLAALLYALSVAEIKTLCDRYRIPSDYRELALLIAEHLNEYRRARELSAEELLSLLQRLDVFRREERFRNFLIACKAIARATATENLQSNWLLKVYETAKAVDTKQFTHLAGKEIAVAINKKRVEAIEKII